MQPLFLSHRKEFLYGQFLECKRRYIKDIKHGNLLPSIRMWTPRDGKPNRMGKVVYFKHNSGEQNTG